MEALYFDRGKDIRDGMDLCGGFMILTHCQSRLSTCRQKNCRPFLSTLTILQEWVSTSVPK